jgi:cell division protein ZapA (FtsZ GTPase activity inhibitor)
VDRLISIELFGQAYTFKASGGVSQAEEITNYVAEEVEKARAAGEAPSKLDTVILAALNIANDYFEVRRSRQDLVRDIDRRCKSLIEHIDTSAW